MIVCQCKGTTDRQIRDALTCGARCADEVGAQCGGAGLVCGGCQPIIDALARENARVAARAPRFSPQFSSVA